MSQILSLVRGNAYKHGLSDSPEYRSWMSMKQRVNSPLHNRYHIYGGRGISYSPTWENFQAFYADMGPRPFGTSLERRDNNGNYCKDNCIWADARRQANNRRTNRIISVGIISDTMANWSAATGVKYTTIKQRLNYGYNDAESVGKGKIVKPLHKIEEEIEVIKPDIVVKG